MGRKGPFSDQEIDFIIALRVHGVEWNPVVKAFNNAFRPKCFIGAIRTIFHNVVKDNRSGVRWQLPRTMPDAKAFNTGLR